MLQPSNAIKNNQTANLISDRCRYSRVLKSNLVDARLVASAAKMNDDERVFPWENEFFKDATRLQYSTRKVRFRVVFISHQKNVFVIFAPFGAAWSL